MTGIERILAALRGEHDATDLGVEGPNEADAEALVQILNDHENWSKNRIDETLRAEGWSGFSERSISAWRDNPNNG